ncbi:MAG: diguanylate cyclase [Syntrophomonas sp.]
MIDDILFEHSLEAMMLIEMDGKILRANRKTVEVYGYSQEEFTAMSMCDLAIDEPQDNYCCSTARENGSIETLHRRKDGGCFSVEITRQQLFFNETPVFLNIIRDITERKQAEEKIRQQNDDLKASFRKIEAINRELEKVNHHLQASETRYHTLFSQSPVGLVKCDSKGRVIDINKCGLEILGCPGPKKFTCLQQLFMPRRVIISIIKNISFILDESQSVSDEVQFTSVWGKKLWVNYSANPILDGEGQITELIIAFNDVTGRKEIEERIRYLSFHDNLTGVYNRTFFDEEIQRLNVPRQMPLSIIMGDLNGLKIVNDAFGHRVGDKLLIKIAGILRASCRKDDIIARWGGDEFVIILPHTDIKVATQVCDRIRMACQQADGDPIQASIALGVASKDNHDEDVFKVLTVAEGNMYRNKLLERSSIRNSIISSLEVTLHEKTHETREHAERLWRLSLPFGWSLGLTRDEMDRLALLAKLHDIGKIAISNNILSKPGPLTEKEWETIKKHPEIGFRITRASHELTAISKEVLTHHERWDGKGYPKGLKADEIPLLARILTIIDTYDVMTHERPYKTASSQAEALQEIVNCAGTQFDPHLVEIFIQLMSP